MELNIHNLRIIASELLVCADGEELVILKEISQDPKPEHRDFLIDVRNQALEQCVFDYAVELSHFIAAMTEEKFWQGEIVEPSSL